MTTKELNYHIKVGFKTHTHIYTYIPDVNYVKLVDRAVQVFYILVNLLSSDLVTIIIEFSISSFNSVTFYFMTFEVLSFFVSSCYIDSFIIVKYSLPIILFPVLKYGLPDINTASPDFLRMLFAQFIVFPSFYFQPVCVFESKMLFLHIVYS